MTLQGFNENNYPIVAVMKPNALMPNGASVPVLGIYDILDSNFGDVIDTLVFLSNPAGNDPPMDFAWSDSDSKWTDSAKAQVPYYVNSATDGLFYMSVCDFIEHFDCVEVAHVVPSFQQLYVDVQNDSGIEQIFNFTVTAPGKTYVGVEYYSPRMYPDNCHNYTVGIMSLLSSTGTIISMTYTSDFELFNYFEFEYL